MTEKEYKAKWYLDNKERLQLQKQKAYYNKKDGYYRVYLLEDYNYVGYTDCIEVRFRNHKTVSNKDCTNHRILFKTKDRTEARRLEKQYHNNGYGGRNIGEFTKIQ